jgi:hypothetical protein
MQAKRVSIEHIVAACSALAAAAGVSVACWKQLPDTCSGDCSNGPGVTVCENGLTQAGPGEPGNIYFTTLFRLAQCETYTADPGTTPFARDDCDQEPQLPYDTMLPIPGCGTSFGQCCFFDSNDVTITTTTPYSIRVPGTGGFNCVGEEEIPE